MPTDINAIDLIAGIPASDANKEWYEPLNTPLLDKCIRIEILSKGDRQLRQKQGGRKILCGSFADGSVTRAHF